MPTRRIEVNEPVTIKPVMRERAGRFEPVPGQYAYYTANGAPLRQGGETVTVQAGDTLVLPAGHRMEALDLRYRNAAGELLGVEQVRTLPAISVENRGRSVGILGNSNKITLAGGNFTMQMPLQMLAGATATPGGIGASGTVTERRDGGFNLNTGSGSIAVAPNTRLDVIPAARGGTILAIDGDEAAARVTARHADMLKTAKEALARGNPRARIIATQGLNPEFTVANTPAAPATRTFPDAQIDVQPDAPARPAAPQQPAVPGGNAPGGQPGGVPGNAPGGAPGTMPGAGRPTPPADRRGPGGVVPPVVPPTGGGTPARPPATQPAPGGQPAADPRREAASGVATDLQTIITTRGTGAGQSPDGRLGFFAARNQGNRVVADAYDAIVEAQRAAKAIADGQANTPEARRNFNTALDNAVDAMQKFEDGARQPAIRNEARSIRERIEAIRTRAQRGNLTSMNIDGAVSADALAMLTSEQQGPSASAPTPETAMSREAIALLTGDNGTRGSVEDLPPALRTPGNTRQV